MDAKKDANVGDNQPPDKKQHNYRTNVGINRRRIIESILESEPNGKSRNELSQDTGLNAETVTENCKQLQYYGWIFKKNKQAKYHITDDVYGYPELIGHSFGREAIGTIWDDIRRELLRSGEAITEQQLLREFASRLSETIVYILIQSLSPKRLFLNRNDEQLVDLPYRINIKNNYHIKRKFKEEMSRELVERAIRPIRLLSEFRRLPIVKRGLATLDAAEH